MFAAYAKRARNGGGLEPRLGLKSVRAPMEGSPVTLLLARARVFVRVRSFPINIIGMRMRVNLLITFDPDASIEVENLNIICWGRLKMTSEENILVFPRDQLKKYCFEIFFMH